MLASFCSSWSDCTGGYLVAANFLLIILIAAVVLKYRLKICRSDTKITGAASSKQPQDEENQAAKSEGLASGRYVDLMPKECLKVYRLRKTLSPGVQSRFVSNDMFATMDYLSRRARFVAHANPWIVGRLRTNPQTCRAALWIPSEPDFNSFLHIVWVDGDNLDDGLETCIVPIGEECLDKDVPLCKLCCIRSSTQQGDSGEEQFILTVVVSHVIGEITAVYRLWGMMNESTPIEELIVERVHNFQDGRLTLLKGDQVWRFLYMVFCSDSSPFRKMTPCTKPAVPMDPITVTLNHVDSEWVEEQKKKYELSTTPEQPQPSGASGATKERVAYLSTADIVTSWFFSQLQPSAAATVMDMRERHPDISRNHMGNYQEMLIFYPAQYENPAEIRRAVMSLGEDLPVDDQGRPLRLRPGRGYSAACLSGWHSRYDDLQLPYCQRLSHLPFVGDFVKGDLPAIIPIAFLFRTSSTGYGLLSFTYGPLKDTSALSKAIPLRS